MAEQLKSRRGVARKENGGVITNYEAEHQRDLEKERLRQQKKIQKQEELKNSLSFSAVKGIKTVLDDYYGDAILGLIPGGIGDWVGAPLTLPYIYVALFKVHSVALALAVIYNWLVDACLGSIPFIGNIIDFFHKGYKKSYVLIVGYVEDDKEIISEVNSNAVKTLILIAILGVILYYLIKMVVAIGNWVAGIF